ncbi:MAG: hypothetical protein GXO78_04050 [Calditrichaeota bacterium]|nr:hypothetical protein [Calditrichota bacterium]
MKKNVPFLLIILLIIIIFGCSPPPTLVKGNIFRVSEKMNFDGAVFAVLPFKSASQGKTFTNRVSTDGNAISDILTLQLLSAGYKVIEREKLNRILQESALSLSGLVTEGNKLTDVGQKIGANYIIYGSVIQYDHQLSKNRWIVAIGVTARFIEVKTGNLVLVCTASSQGQTLAEALAGISMAIVSAMKEEKIYVWQQ